MEEDFAQGTTPLGALRGILGNYPYSVGMFREILQNSEDAGATKQTFVLDRRTHPTDSLYHPNLAATQGPALLAYNDAKFNENDWEALKFAYESSKANDSSRIGKYGVGFRSVFHITDCPQIVSGEFFAMFDPLKAFTDSAGKKLSFAHVFSQNPAQMAPFGWFLNAQSSKANFEGTIIRCPLRHEASKINSKIVSAEDITHLFHEFVSEEIHIALLFLRNIQRIELYDVDPQGISSCVAQLTIARSLPVSCGDNSTTYVATMISKIKGLEDKQVYRVIQCPFHRDEAIQLLSRGSIDPSRILKEHKLLPEVGIAAPLDLSPRTKTSGRLFTFLPLPLPTGFPLHIHAYFALTQSRQNLRNSKEIGLVPGTDDHILIDWNKVLFEHYIPQAWKSYLQVQAGEDSTSDIFSVWPPKQHLEITSGESVYWASLPANVFKYIASSNSSVWPVFCGVKQTNAECLPLDLLIAADPSIPDRVIQALTDVGLQFTCPPQYIMDLIKNSGGKKFPILTPEEAHKGLLQNLPRLQSASKEQIATILEYLLSTHNMLAIVGLPIIPVTSGKMVALSSATSDPSITYTMLDRVEFDVFGACEDNAIVLQNLPFKVAETLQRRGPDFLNVTALTVPRIIDYLTTYPNRLGLDLSLVRTDPYAIKWLSAFWVWLSTYAHKQELYPKILHLYLLPSSRGLRKAETPLFRSRGEHPVQVRHLSTLGVPFLDGEVSEKAQSILLSYGLLSSISNIHALLDSLPETIENQPLSKEVCETILKLIASRANVSCIDRGPFSQEQIRRLRNLPIFPVIHLPPSADPSSKFTTRWTSLPADSVVHSVQNAIFVPLLSGTLFVQLSSIAPDILRYLDSTPLSDIQLVSLTVEHFVNQPDHIQAAVLSYIVNHRRHIPPYILDMLQHTEFVVVQDGSRKKPSDVVDPTSTIASLYEDSPCHQIRNAKQADHIIVRALQSLELLRRKLSIEILRERVDAISSQPLDSRSIKLARRLLSLTEKEHLDYSHLNIPPDKKWLPTKQGLRGSTECRDGSQLSPNLFNRVLAVLDHFSISLSLRKGLHWDEPLATEIIIQQLDKVLKEDENTFPVVLDIIKELGKRNYTSSQLSLLQTATHGRKWVPTTDQQLSETLNAVFLQPQRESGFHQIYPVNQETKEFLRRMECTDSPSVDAIVSKLESLSQDPPSFNTVNVALSLLRSTPPNLDDQTRGRLLIPDESNILRPFSETFFNDIGDQARLIPTGHSFISHHLLDESLSRKLALGRLGLKYAGLSLPGIDMGEKPVITVRKTLSQYNEKQFAGEFFANAADAGATEFTLMLNGFRGESAGNIRALSPNFCLLPSLVVYNNAIFTDGDFEGICRTSVGGKAAKRDTIGQFGLGALTMFHFTELAMVISGDKILFLNPAKAHLPVPVAARVLSLNSVRKFYPSQLASINGLFGFDISSESPYNGTIFLLPLREDKHFSGGTDSISHVTWSPADIRNILEQFRNSASDCLLFTRMQRVQAITRESSGSQTTLWSFEAIHDAIDIETATGYTMADVFITDASGAQATWAVTKTEVADTLIPEEFQLLAVERRLRLPPVAGLAILKFASLTETNAFKFFSTLPLGIRTSLPLHIMASFVLSSDRRQIRLDDYGGPETRYNLWLLNNIIPPLYLFLLEHILGEQNDNRQWWPQHRKEDDVYSRHIVESFYSTHLRCCTRRIFCSIDDSATPLTVQDAVVSGDEPTNIKEALLTLGSLRTVNIPSGAQHLATEKAGVAKVTPGFLKEEILRNPSVITRASFEVLAGVIKYLSGDRPEDPTHLLGLPILPLEDGSFGTFEDNWSSTRYYVWMPRRPIRSLIFPPQHFVHHELKVRDILKMQINVVPLDPSIIKQFVEAKFADIDASTSTPPELVDWIYNFWEIWPEYDHLGLKSTDILTLPLVPTVQSNIFVSLSQCQDGPAVLIGGSNTEAELLRACLDQLGLKVVRTDEEPTPLALRLILRDSVYPSLTFSHLLTAISKTSDDSTIAEKLLNLNDDVHTAFASWARDGITEISEPLLSIAQELPIWPSTRKGSGMKLCPASNIHILPNGLSMTVAARFMNTFVSNSPRLKLLNGPILTFEQLENGLELPSVLETDDLMLYKTLLDTWVKNLPSSSSRPLPVPNANLMITPSDQLYARHPLFEAAFGDDPTRFMPHEFTELEQSLHKHGLRSENQLDVPMFRICAEAINNMEADDMVIRATVLFEAYGFQLPMRVRPDEQHLWQELDRISFIPRNVTAERRLEDMNPNTTGLAIPAAILSLPHVVSPLDLVKKEYEAIAWTQRAFFDEQPHQRVLIAHPALGKPETSDVIRHLQSLSSFENLTPSQRHVLLHDLNATYAYLNGISSLTGQEKDQLANGKNFLNVDDPNNDEWRWDNCDQLVFETQDTEGYIRHVHGFLLPFEKLLRNVGVLQVYHPQYSGDSSPNSETSKLAAIRSGFNKLRQQNALTDVVFVGTQYDADDVAEDSIPLMAHRAFLAVSSEFFNDAFCGTFSESRVASPTDPVEFPVAEQSRRCVQLILEYIYTGSYSKLQTSLELLLETMQLSGYWQIMDLFEEMQKEIIVRRLISPWTLDEIREAAKVSQAENLLLTCTEYAEKNSDYIQKVRHASTAD